MVHFVETSVESAAGHQLLGEYFAERAAGFPAEQGQYMTTFPQPEQFVPPAGQFVLALEGTPGDDGEPVGCGGVRRIQRADAGLVRFELKHLFLRPSVRGRGYGGLLLAELERRALLLGAEEIVLDTNASLESAGALYRRAGYSDIAAYNANPNATNWYGKPLAP
ncbi:MAG TPA: GNAT family N-acetyltransferase [Microterricola sp.]